MLTDARFEFILRSIDGGANQAELFHIGWKQIIDYVVQFLQWASKSILYTYYRFCTVVQRVPGLMFHHPPATMGPE